MTKPRIPGHHWTDSEKAMLREIYPTMQVAEVAAKMGMREKQVSAQALYLGLKMTKAAAAAARYRPPTRRQKMVDMLTAAGETGVSMDDIAQAYPDSTPQAARMNVTKLREAGIAYSIRRFGFTRYYAASVPLGQAEAMFANLTPPTTEQKAEARKAERAIISAERARAKKDRRNAADRAKTQANSVIKYTKKQGSFVEKLAAGRSMEDRRAEFKASNKSDYVLTEADRAKIVFRPTPPPRFAPDGPIYGGFGSLRPGQYAFDAVSCAARCTA